MRRTTRILITPGVLAGGLCLSLILLPGLRHPVRLFFPGASSPRRPDLIRCTRVEIRYWPSILQQFFGNALKKSLLSASEVQHISSLDPVVLIDPNDINVLACEVASAEYLGVDPKPIQVTEYVEVTGYIDSKPDVPFSIWGEDLRLEEGQGYHIFRNNRLSFCLSKLRPQVRPFERRIHCALRLQSLQKRLRQLAEPEAEYPEPSQWCDATARFLRAQNHPEHSIKWTFICPSVREGRSTYAMNPNCRPTSPADMVLVFETQAGWNQHGGPELFTFENHQPRGGVALLNDGTVKFIRSEEELQQLRWE